MFPSLIHLFYQPVYCVNLRLTAYISNLLYFDYTILDLSGEYQSNCYIWIRLLVYTPAFYWD